MIDRTDYLTERAGTWIYYRGVPTEYVGLDGRRFIRISTKVKVANNRTGTKAGRVAGQDQRDPGSLSPMAGTMRSKPTPTP